MNALITKVGVGFCIALIMFLCFSIYKTKQLEKVIEQKNEEIVVLDFSAKAGETTLKAILENEKNNDERIKELEKERLVLRAQSKQQRDKLEGLIKNDEKSNQWARDEIPNSILSLLLDDRP